MRKTAVEAILVWSILPEENMPLLLLPASSPLGINEDWNFGGIVPLNYKRSKRKVPVIHVDNGHSHTVRGGSIDTSLRNRYHGAVYDSVTNTLFETVKDFDLCP